VEKRFSSVTMVLDVNKDDRIDEKDGIMIARYLLGLRG